MWGSLLEKKMAPLCKICRMTFINNFVKKRNPGICYRFVSTSEKKKEAEKPCPPPEVIYRKVPDFSKPSENKNWISFGFHEEDQTEDKLRMHFTYFVFLTYLICGGSFLYAYVPDRDRSDWCRREAFIRLHEREQLGLDPIDQNYIDPSLIILPPDEELDEEDIVI